VVAAGSTPKAAVNDALATIDGAAEVIGLVLNRARGGQTAGYGLYGYGYGQGKS
jgi:hypothetical protein